MKALLAVFFILAVNESAWALECAGAAKELSRLRLMYKVYSTESHKAGGVTFDGLTEILDKIVNLKSEMRKSNCKVPPRKSN